MGGEQCWYSLRLGCVTPAVLGDHERQLAHVEHSTPVIHHHKQPINAIAPCRQLP